MVILCLLIVLRMFIIATRHATTPPRIYREYYKQPLTPEMLNEGLMRGYWTKINQEDISKEITKSLLKNEINTKFFNFRVLLPVYTPLKKYLLDDNAYEDEEMKWQYDKFV